MKRFAIVVALAAGCSSVDTNNGVTTDQYRQSIGKAEASIAAATSRMIVSTGKDRDQKWWDSQIADLQATRDQLHDTLQGANK